MKKQKEEKEQRSQENRKKGGWGGSLLKKKIILKKTHPESSPRGKLSENGKGRPPGGGAMNQNKSSNFNVPKTETKNGGSAETNIKSARGG